MYFTRKKYVMPVHKPSTQCIPIINIHFIKPIQKYLRVISYIIISVGPIFLLNL